MHSLHVAVDLAQHVYFHSAHVPVAGPMDPLLSMHLLVVAHQPHEFASVQSEQLDMYEHESSAVVPAGADVGTDAAGTANSLNAVVLDSAEVVEEWSVKMRELRVVAVVVSLPMGGSTLIFTDATV